jgi:hypothetical protein
LGISELHTILKDLKLQSINKILNGESDKDNFSCNLTHKKFLYLNIYQLHLVILKETLTNINQYYNLITEHLYLPI